MVAAVVTAAAFVATPAVAATDTPLATTPTAPPGTTPTAAVGAWTASVARPLVGMPTIRDLDLIAAGKNATLARVAIEPVGVGPSRLAFASVAADGTVGTLHEPKQSVVGGPVFDRRGRGTVLLGLASGGLAWSTMRADGTISAPHQLGKAEFGVRLAVDADGNTIIAWLDRNAPFEDRETGGSRFRVRVALRPGGGSIRKLETLPINPAYEAPDLSVAVGAGGRVVVAMAETPADAANRVVAWTGSVRGGLGPRQTVGRQASNTSVSSAMTPAGGVALAWGTQSKGEEVSSGWRVRASTLAPGSSRFSAMKELDPGGPKSLREDVVMVVPDEATGGALLVWDNLRRGEIEDVSMATVSRRGKLSSRRTLASDATAAKVALGPRGAAIVTWIAGDPAQGNATYRAPDRTTFATPEEVPGRRTGISWQPFFWPSTGRLVMAALQPPAAEGGDPSLVIATRAR